jgi:hypothetical protein
VLTRAGRDDRRLLRQLDERQQQLEQAAKQCHAWLEQHLDTFSYRDELAGQVASRREALGTQGVATQPKHLVDLLGPVPDDAAARSRWTRSASGIEAYREQWGVDAEDRRRPPVDGVRYRDWTAAVETVEMLRRLAALQLEPGVDRSLGIEL